MKIQISEEKCIGCGRCVKDCVALNLRIVEGKVKVGGPCIMCGHCYAVCPENAVIMPSEYEVSDTEMCQNGLKAVSAESLLHCVKSRRSIRDYKRISVEQDKLEKILQAGRYTATAVNNQDCRFIFVQRELEVLKTMVWEDIDRKTTLLKDNLPENLIPYASFNKRRKANPEDDYLFRNAPVVLLIASSWPLDAGLAAQNMELMAVSQGLGMLYNGFLARIVEENGEIKKWMGIEDIPVKACMLLGYPRVEYMRTAPRKPAHAVWM